MFTLCVGVCPLEGAPNKNRDLTKIMDIHSKSHTLNSQPAFVCMCGQGVKIYCIKSYP